MVVKINLNFDDFHPQPKKYSGHDFGGDLDGIVFNAIEYLIEQFPKIKISMFTVPNWLYLPYPRLVYLFKRAFAISPYSRLLSNDPFHLSKHPEWVSRVNELISKGNLEICIHGLNHVDPMSKISAQEFKNVTFDGAISKIKVAESILEDVGIKFSKVFRPPGWGYNGHLISAARSLGYKLSLFPSHFRIISGNVNGVPLVPQNYSIAESVSVGSEIVKRGGVLYAKGHITNNYFWEKIPNGITMDRIESFVRLVDSIAENYSIKFVGLG